MRTHTPLSERNSDIVRDRRVRKTRRALHEALGSLIAEKSYETIAIQEIIDRANVGRTTFYEHFQDKDALLAESIRNMLPDVAPRSISRDSKWYERIIGFSESVFEHHDRHRRTREAKMGKRGRVLLHEHLRATLAELIAAALREQFDERSAAETRRQEVLALYVASTFVLVLNWWVESEEPLPVDEANAVFRSLVIPTLDAATWYISRS